LIGFHTGSLSVAQGDSVTLTEMTVTAIVTLGTVATAAVSVDIPELSRQAEGTAGQANCRAVDTAILAYYSEEQVLPTAIKDVEPYIQGDISAYRIVSGKAAGPGCGPAAKR
jgi:hypothetical protein